MSKVAPGYLLLLLMAWFPMILAEGFWYTIPLHVGSLLYGRTQILLFNREHLTKSYYLTGLELLLNSALV